MKPRAILDIQIQAAGWHRILRLRAQLEKAAKKTLMQLPEKFPFPCTITLLLTNDSTIRQLNRDFRGIDKPTNVLSFPQFDPRKLPKKGKEKAPILIGDIAIAYQYVVGETKKNHKILINHLTHLLIHGILHLFGYDHEADTKAVRMERLEGKI